MRRMLISQSYTIDVFKVSNISAKYAKYLRSGSQETGPRGGHMCKGFIKEKLMGWGKQDGQRGKAGQRGHLSRSWPFPGPLGTLGGWVTIWNLFLHPKMGPGLLYPAQSLATAPRCYKLPESTSLCTCAEGPSHPRAILENTAAASDGGKAHRTCDVNTLNP